MTWGRDPDNLAWKEPKCILRWVQNTHSHFYGFRGSILIVKLSGTPAQWWLACLEVPSDNQKLWLAGSYSWSSCFTRQKPFDLPQLQSSSTASAVWTTGAQAFRCYSYYRGSSSSLLSTGPTDTPLSCTLTFLWRSWGKCRRALAIRTPPAHCSCNRWPLLLFNRSRACKYRILNTDTSGTTDTTLSLRPPSSVGTQSRWFLWGFGSDQP